MPNDLDPRIRYILSVMMHALITVLILAKMAVYLAEQLHLGGSGEVVDLGPAMLPWTLAVMGIFFLAGQQR